MTDKVVILISDKVLHTAATRACGKEAFSKILQQINEWDERPLQFVIDFRHITVLTASFLDELVLRHDTIPDDITLVFWLNSDDHLKKLKEVCAARGVQCRYQLGEDLTIKYTRRKTIPNVKVHEYHEPFFST